MLGDLPLATAHCAMVCRRSLKGKVLHVVSDAEQPFKSVQDEVEPELELAVLVVAALADEIGDRSFSS